MIRTILLLSVLLHSSLMFGNVVSDGIREMDGNVFKLQRESATEQNGDKDVTWFKDQLKISSKYQERERGIFGLSWPHFITMIFLICSMIIALVAMVVRHRRTKELLNLLLKEEKEDGIKS